MKKQRICIVGDGLAGLMTALALKDLSTLDVQIIAKKIILKKTRELQLYQPQIMNFFIVF